MDPFVFQANVKATNVTDPVLIRQYQKELMDYLGPSQAVKETISVVSYSKNSSDRKILD